MSDIRTVRRLSKGALEAKTYRQAAYDRSVNDLAADMLAVIEPAIPRNSEEAKELSTKGFVEEGTEERTTKVGVRGDHSRNPYGDDVVSTVAFLVNFGTSRTPAANFMERGAALAESRGLERR